MTNCSIHLHGFTTLADGSQEHSDDWMQIDGWCVYIRTETPNDPQQPFDINNEADFADFPTAKAHAQGLARCLFCDPDDWNHD